MEVVPPDMQASKNRLRMLAWNLSWMVATAAGGWLIGHHGFTPNMASTIGLNLLSADLLWRFFRGYAGRRESPVTTGGAGERQSSERIAQRS